MIEENLPARGAATRGSSDVGVGDYDAVRWRRPTTAIHGATRRLLPVEPAVADGRAARGRGTPVDRRPAELSPVARRDARWDQGRRAQPDRVDQGPAPLVGGRDALGSGWALRTIACASTGKRGELPRGDGRRPRARGGSSSCPLLRRPRRRSPQLRRVPARASLLVEGTYAEAIRAVASRPSAPSVLQPQLRGEPVPRRGEEETCGLENA
jgi:hypothetical protein